MMETVSIPELISKAKEKLTGPLLQSRDVDRAIFVGDTHTAIDVTQTVFDRYYEEADLIVFLGDYVDRGKTGVENLGLIATKFLEENSLKGIIRGHEVVDGFREDMDGRVITVFSSRYHGSSAGILVMDNDMMEQVRI